MNSKKWDSNLIFDTHIHLFDERYQQSHLPDWRVLVNNAMKTGVGYFLNVGITIETSKKAIVQAEDYANIWVAVGVHPTYINQLNKETQADFVQLLSHSKVIAIGEIGLDYHHQFTSKKDQQKGLHLQLQLAVQYKLPVLLHIRNAYDDAYMIVSQYPVTGIVHCFSGTLNDAQKFIQLGFLISFSGTITFQNAKQLQAIAQQIPLEKIVVETDAPYLTPHPNRGQINLPEYINLTIEKIANIHKVNIKTTKQIITNQTLKILNLS